MPDNRGLAEDCSEASPAKAGLVERPEVCVLRLRPEAVVPQYKSELAAGMDGQVTVDSRPGLTEFRLTLPVAAA